MSVIITLPRLVRAAAFCLTLALLTLSLARTASATTYYVATTGSGLNNGMSWSAPKSDLQATITAAQSGDQVWVEKGTYTNSSNFLGKDSVAVYGGFAGTETSIGQRDIVANPTILNYSNGSNNPVYTAAGMSELDGFTIENGAQGGLVNINTLNVANCTFINNGVSAFAGGGIFTDGNTTITGCTFIGNSVPEGYGGGIYAVDTPITISNCKFTDNSAPNGYGGGIYVGNMDLIIKGCTFTNNSNGAIYVDGATPTIISCTFGDTNASDADSPSAISLHGAGSSSAMPAVVKDCLIIGSGTATTDPDGIGVDLDSSDNTSYVTIANNTIVNSNVGVDIATEGGAISIANNIFEGDYGSLNTTGSPGPMFTSSHNDNYGNVSY